MAIFRLIIILAFLQKFVKSNMGHIRFRYLTVNSIQTKNSFQKIKMENSLAIIKHLKNEYEEVCLSELKVRSQLDYLNELLAEKRSKIETVEKENSALNEKALSLTQQCHVTDNVVKDYQDIRK